MDANRRNERLKQLVQVLIDKKNSGKQVGSIAKMANMGMKEFKNIAYKFKEIFGISLHFSPGLQLILTNDQLDMVNYVEEKVLKREEKPDDGFTTIDHIATLLMHVLYFRNGKITETELKNIMTEKLEIDWDKPDSLHGGKSAKQIVSQLVKDNMIKKVSVAELSVQSQIEGALTKELTYEIGSRAKTIYNWEMIFRSGIRNIEQSTEEVLPPSEVMRAQLHCKQTLEALTKAKYREREKSDIYNKMPARNTDDDML